MKKLFTLALGLLFGTTAFAQSDAVPTKKMYNPAAQKSAVFNKKNKTGFEKSDGKTPEVPLSAWARGLGSSIGLTNYDLQTNSTMKPRLINHGNGNLSGAFIYGTGSLPAGVANRGTGYNTKPSGGNFGQFPSKRVETVRTGFGNLIADADGNEYIIAHTALTSGFGLVMSKKLKGASTWTQSNIPTSIPNGVLWASAAIGGNNGKTIHVVAATDLPYKGLERALPYYRSLDGGLTWDKKDVQLPGLDSTRYTTVSADNYTITTQGDNVAITHFGTWNNTETWISSDNGNNWTRKTIYEFPLKLYKINDGYDPATLPKDAARPNPYAIFTSDEAGTAFFDKSNKLHVMFPRSYVNDSITDDATGFYRFYSGTNGLVHWDESYKKDSLLYVESWPDLNNNNTIDIGDEGYGNYGRTLTTYLSSAVADNGTIYIAYSSVTEDAVTADDANYRRIYIISSKDNGKNWSKPYAVNNTKYFLEGEGADLEFAECVFPALAKKVDATKLYLSFQVDYEQGLHVLDYDDPTAPIDFSDNVFQCAEIDLTDLITSNKDIIQAENIAFQLSPNPTSNAVNVEYTLEESSNTAIKIVDVTGKTVKYINLGKQEAGKQYYNLQTDLVSGLYLLQLNIDNKISTRKLIIK